ncbi:MAG TPA: hypothetical protein VFQ44_09815 [Streptosporangiaceae bacterium]|nr:hypothetical protein [Streptosporangiaceae bacterium]
MNERNLVSQIRSVMGPGNPAPLTGCEGDPVPQTWLAAQIAELRVADLAAVDEPELRFPASAGGRGDHGLGSRGPTWRVLAPALSVLAVVAVAVSLAVSAATTPRQQVPGSASSPASGAPPFYLTINGLPPHTVAVLHDSRTGDAKDWEFGFGFGDSHPVATAYKVGAQWKFQIVSWNTRAHPAYVDVNVLIPTRLGSTGRDSKVPVDAPGPQAKIEAAAHCQSGLAIAFGVPSPHAGVTSEIDLIAHGKVRSWTAPGTAATPSDLACAGQHKIAFLWTNAAGTSSQLRLLDTTAPGHSLLATRVVASGGGTPLLITSAFASPAGPIIATEIRNIASLGRCMKCGAVQTKLIGLSPMTGKVVRTFKTFMRAYHGPAERRAAERGCVVLSLDTSGTHALIRCLGLQRLDGDVLTRLAVQKPVDSRVAHQIQTVTW